MILSSTGIAGLVCKLEDLINYKAKDLVQEIIDNHIACMQSKPSMSQIRAWVDEIIKLRAAVRQLPEEFLDLDVVFEYRIPTSLKCDRFIYPDVLIVSYRKIMVLEFKQLDASVEKVFGGEATKYKRHLKDNHPECKKMRIRTYMVLTKEKTDFKKFYDFSFHGNKCRYTQISCNLLAEEIYHWFEKWYDTYNDFDDWLRATWIF
ncbi:MAG: hypothetical protein K5765_06025 [Clostridia bacterium]|nr:hypothetical protein [Clostridia bacterium]